jgi:hypothetical protein
MSDRIQIEREIEAGIVKMQADLGINSQEFHSSCGEGSGKRFASERCGLPTRKAGSGTLPQETYSSLYHIGGLLMGASLIVMSVFIFAVKAKAEEIKCDWDMAIALLASDKRFGKPITAGNETAMRLAAIANLNPSKQSMIVPMHGSTPDELKIVIITCGPNETWTPRHFIIDVEAERKFYDLAPPVIDEPKPVRTRKGRQ